MLVDRVKQAVSLGGTGDLTLGAADAGFRTIANAGVPTGTILPIVIQDGNAWEVGNYRWDSGSVSLLRSSTDMIASSTGSLLNVSTSARIWVGFHSGFGVCRKVKRASTSRTTSAVSALDPDLQINLGVGVWRIRVVAFMTGTANSDYRFSMSFGSANVELFHRRYTITAGAVAGTDNENTHTSSAVAEITALGTTAGQARVEIEAVINVTGASLNGFAWGQGTSHADPTTCMRGSYIEWEKI